MRCNVALWMTPEKSCVYQPPPSASSPLSPGATELMFAAGAGDKVMAVVNYSDYPPAALERPLIGSHTRVDMEALIGALILIWWLPG
ncbi:MAG: hypothetical protein MH208_09805 [Marinobacter sp.]|nr:hypothetical protein [Marinobacter sp.]